MTILEVMEKNLNRVKQLAQFDVWGNPLPPLEPVQRVRLCDVVELWCSCAGCPEYEKCNPVV